jgi:hypothetical protein
MAAKFRFGKKTILRVAPIIAFAADGTPTKPAAASFVVLCQHNEVKVGLQNGKFDLENFCTGGRTISVRDGTQTGTLDFGNLTWVEDDPAVKMMEDAAFSTTETGGNVWVEVLPLGAGVGKPFFTLIIDVEEWELTSPSKGAITAAHKVTVIDGPQRGALPA